MKKEQKNKIAIPQSSLSAQAGLFFIIYSAFCIYLYIPYFPHLITQQYLLIVSSPIGALGVFILSRRWVSSCWCSFAAGALYGFGPFVLSLSQFHITASLLGAFIPWLFMPAVFWFRKKRNRLLTIMMMSFPFMAIIGFFQLSARLGLFAMPIQTTNRFRQLYSLLYPLIPVYDSVVTFSFYHIPVSLIVFGTAMFITAKRHLFLYVTILGMVLGVCKSFLLVSPLIWFSIPAVWGSIYMATGMEGFLLAGKKDAKWFVIIALIASCLGLFNWFCAKQLFCFTAAAENQTLLFYQSVQLHILAGVLSMMMFFLCRSCFHFKRFRLCFLSAAVLLDIFICSMIVIRHVM